jgi:hypothetical protein
MIAQESAMQPTFLKILAFVFCLNLAAFGQQSLGDIARQYRDKLQADEAAGNAPKMYTNQDIPPADMVGTPEPPAERRSSYRAFDNHSADGGYSQPAAGEWRRNIVMQQNRVAGLQIRIERLNAMLHSPYGTVQYDGPYNRNQARAQERLGDLQQALDVERQKLDTMQDAARHAGMHTTVYDP